MRDDPNFDPAWDTPIWGADGMASALNTSTRRVYHMLYTGQIDADKVGNIWVSTRRRLLGKIARPEVEAA